MANSSKELELLQLRYASLHKAYSRTRQLLRAAIRTLNSLDSELKQAAEGVEIQDSWGQDLDSEQLAELLAKVWHYQRSGKQLKQLDLHVIDLHVYRYMVNRKQPKL